MAELADALNAYLIEMARADAPNHKGPDAKILYFGSRARAAGAYVAITYISYQGARNLTRADAEFYLQWLDRGNRGRHYTPIRERDGAI